MRWTDWTIVVGVVVELVILLTGVAESLAWARAGRLAELWASDRGAWVRWVHVAVLGGALAVWHAKGFRR